jgi:hypothetical protein
MAHPRPVALDRRPPLSRPRQPSRQAPLMRLNSPQLHTSKKRTRQKTLSMTYLASVMRYSFSSSHTCSSRRNSATRAIRRSQSVIKHTPDLHSF